MKSSSNPPSPRNEAEEETSVINIIFRKKAPANIACPAPLKREMHTAETKNTASTENIIQALSENSAPQITPEPIKVTLVDELNIPVKARSKNDYEIISKPSNKSAHTSYTVTKRGSEKDDVYYLKLNNEDNPISETECCASQFYNILAPGLTPVMRAIYNSDFKFIGAISRELKGFQPLTVDPLTEKNLEMPEIIKNLAITLSTSYLFRENDLHANNLSKYGKIDNDMTLFHILCHFKNSKYLGLDTYLRRCPKIQYRFTAKDIDNFPNLTDAEPYYWPTKSTGPSSSSTRVVETVCSWFQTTSSNKYSEKDCIPFLMLRDNPIFVYHKFKTFLKYILTDASLYQAIAEMHIRSDITTPDGKNLIDLLKEDQAESIRELRDVLITMPTFHHFLETQGEQALKEIMDEFSTYNLHLNHKIEKNITCSQMLTPEDRVNNNEIKRKLSKNIYYEKIKINLDGVVMKFQEIKTQIAENNTESATRSPIPAVSPHLKSDA